MFRLAPVLLLALSVSSAAWAAAPRATLEQVFTEANRILTDPEIDGRPLARFAAVEKLVGDAFDFRGAAELAFGRRWPGVPPAEQKEFTRLYARLLTRAYLFRLTSRANLDGGVKVQYLNEAVDGREALVRTSVARRDGGETLADYRMIEHDGRWRARDVFVDGYSVAANYRAQVGRILETSSVPDLLSQMRAKLGPEPSVPAEPAVASVAPAPRPTPEPQRAESPDGAQTVSATAVASTTPVAETPPPATAVASTTPIAQTPPPPATAMVGGAAPTTRTYWLQMGAFSTVEEAGQLAAHFNGSKIVMAPEGLGAERKSVLKIRVGPFTDAAQAVSELLELQTKGYDPFLVAERN